MSYKNKYLKYKNKYLNLKSGGSSESNNYAVVKDEYSSVIKEIYNDDNKHYSGGYNDCDKTLIRDYQFNYYDPLIKKPIHNYKLENKITKDIFDKLSEKFKNYYKPISSVSDVPPTNVDSNLSSNYILKNEYKGDFYENDVKGSGKYFYDNHINDQNFIKEKGSLNQSHNFVHDFENFVYTLPTDITNDIYIKLSEKFQSYYEPPNK